MLLGGLSELTIMGTDGGIDKHLLYISVEVSLTLILTSLIIVNKQNVTHFI